jgi:triacylglycerol lipase
MFWLFLGAIALPVAVAGVLLLWWRPWRGPRTRYPLVLAHGLFGFGEIAAGPIRQQYFHGIVPRLRELGVEVHCPSVPPVAAIAVRAEALARAVRAIPAKKVNIIAHSMGGLDARYAIARLGLAERVASLITIGTPHRGSPVADTGMKLLGVKLGLEPLLSLVGFKAFLDLTEESSRSFNRSVRDVRGVFYASVVATVDGERHPVHPLLRPSLHFMLEGGQPSDGLVPADSQRWGKILRRIHADHWAQVGWTEGLDAPALYLSLLNQLRRRRR